MLRHTRRFLVMDMPPPAHVLAAWKAAQISDFHDSRPGYLSDLYHDCAKSDPFSVVLKINHEKSGTVRYMVSAPMTYRDKCQRVPFLIDTSCRKSMVHLETFRRMVNRDDGELPRSAGNYDSSYVEGVYVGNHCYSYPGVKFNRNTYEIMSYGLDTYGYQNVLGADFLDVAVPELDKHLSQSLAAFQSPVPTEEFVVSDGVVCFKVVTPSKPTTMHLKEAIKAKLEPELNHIAAIRIVITDPDDGRVLCDTDEPVKGVTYNFDVRPPPWARR